MKSPVGSSVSPTNGIHCSAVATTFPHKLQSHIARPQWYYRWVYRYSTARPTRPPFYIYRTVSATIQDRLVQLPVRTVVHIMGPTLLCHTHTPTHPHTHYFERGAVVYIYSLPHLDRLVLNVENTVQPSSWYYHHSTTR
jgi:hypothetical protein